MNTQKLETLRLDIIRANEAFNKGNHGDAWTELYRACMVLAVETDSVDSQALFISSCLELAQLGFLLGKNIYDITALLVKALNEAVLSGDRRSQALINLHLGRFYYFSQRRADAFDAFEKGRLEVEDLGDEDIQLRSAELIGMNYFTQGLFKDAYPYFEKGITYLESVENDMLTHSLSPLFLAYCAAYMGNFHHAIGTLDYYRRFYMDRGNRQAATILRAALGIILLMIRKDHDAHFHLTRAESEAISNNNGLALYLSRGGLIYHMFQKGEVEKSYTLADQLFKETRGMGLRRQYASPMILEALYEYHRQGYQDIGGTNFNDELTKTLQEPNLFLRGVGLRLRAHDTLSQKGERERVREDLEKSREYLTRSGSAVQLAKTLVELARFELKEDNTEGARGFANLACKELGGYTKDFYPDDLQFLLRDKDDINKGHLADEDLLIQFMDIFQKTDPSLNLDSVFKQVVKSVNRLFGAERGGLFWFDQKTSKGPVLKAGHNLTISDLNNEDFRSNMALIFETCRTGQPRMVQAGGTSGKDWPYQCKAILSLPLEMEDRVMGVLYFDNSYTTGCFDLLQDSYLKIISKTISKYIGGIYSHALKKKDVDRQKNNLAPSSESPEIITQNSGMLKILEQTDRVSETQSTILILGETGIGKELLARRIHNKSRQAGNSFVIVDLTTIPESLVESELFGHEKGAFTGADSQKKGLIELAHEGTLFIDEIGDIPLPVQVKLLRLIQEKTLMRVGSTKTLFSNFRLVAATNRNLKRMVSEGTFREDLYYRIHVFPVKLPALRDRMDDVPLLARYFLKRLASKYHHPELTMTPDDDRCLTSHPWPGNIRELQNVMERAVLLSQNGKLDFNLQTGIKSFTSHPFEDLPTLEEIQRRYIRYVLEKTQGKKSGPDSACEILDMKQSTLFNRMKKLGM
jgi:transcriptional regulator with GAF, ATPase, and Fis domain